MLTSMRSNLKSVFGIFYIFLLSCKWVPVYAQTNSGSPVGYSVPIEITEKDISTLKDFNASKATVFGVHLGMEIKDARYAVENFSGFPLSFEQDKFNNDRFYIYSNNGKRKTLAYLLWPDRDSGLKEIILFEDAKEYIPGGNNLFSKQGLDSNSFLFKTFFGRPAKSLVELNIESIHLKNTRYYFPSHALALVECEKGEEIKYQLVIYTVK